MKQALFAAVSVIAMAGTAAAADLPRRMPAPEYIAPAFSWTGFYIGAFGAAAHGDAGYYSDIDDTFPYEGDSSGGLIGVQAGANYQVNNFVFGGVIDIALTNIEAGASGGGITINSEVNYLASLRAKAGYAADTFLAYVHGGAVVSETDTSATFDISGSDVGGFSGDTRLGFTVGAGLEVKAADNISLFAEYAYTDLGDNVVFTNPPGAADFELEEKIRFHTVKAGVNFHF